MLKKIIAIIAISATSSAWSEELDPDKVIVSTIALLTAEKPTEAFENAIKSNIYFNDMKSSIDSAKIEFVSFVKQVGSPTKCEKLVSRDLIQRYRKDVYLCLSAKQPFELNFEFYKQKDSWRIQSFSFSSNIDDYIDKSIHEEIGKKSELNVSKDK